MGCDWETVQYTGPELQERHRTTTISARGSAEINKLFHRASGHSGCRRKRGNDSSGQQFSAIYMPASYLSRFEQQYWNMGPQTVAFLRMNDASRIQQFEEGAQDPQ